MKDGVGWGGGVGGGRKRTRVDSESRIERIRRNAQSDRVRPMRNHQLATHLGDVDPHIVTVDSSQIRYKPGPALRGSNRRRPASDTSPLGAQKHDAGTINIHHHPLSHIGSRTSSTLACHWTRPNLTSAMQPTWIHSALHTRAVSRILWPERPVPPSPPQSARKKGNRSLMTQPARTTSNESQDSTDERNQASSLPQWCRRPEQTRMDGTPGP